MNHREVEALMQEAGCTNCEVAYQAGRPGPFRIGVRHSRPGTMRVDYHGSDENLVEKLAGDHVAWSQETVEVASIEE